MYVGHLGVALGASAIRRTIPIWLLLIAAQIPDWLDAGFCATTGNRGPEALYTHGIPVVVAFAIGLAVLYTVKARDMLGGALVAGVVLSHYALDFLTGTKPTWPGGPIVGLSLYSRPILELALEAIVLSVGWLMYRYSIPKSHRNGWQVYGILLTLLVFQAIAGVFFYYNAAGQLKC